MLAMLTPYRYIILAVAFLAMMAGAYYKGYSHEHDKLVAFEAQAAQAAHDKEIQDDQQTVYVANAYNDYYQRLVQRLRNINKGGLPSKPESAKGTDGAQQELSGACKGTEFYNNALEDALKLQMWQEWAVRQNIPVGD